MKNSADQGGCYPPRPKAEVDNTRRDLQNSSYPTKAERARWSHLARSGLPAVSCKQNYPESHI